LGEYWQAPHKYSAAKYEGKPLHEWARSGVDIEKEKKLRNIYKIEVQSYEFPKLSIRFSVSSGTYIRTLFSECANYLGTLGTLQDLIREQVGGCNINNCLNEAQWDSDAELLTPQEVLPFPTIVFEQKESKLFSNGVQLKFERAQNIIPNTLDTFNLYWVENPDNKLLGLALCESKDESLIKSKVIFN